MCVARTKLQLLTADEGGLRPDRYLLPRVRRRVVSSARALEHAGKRWKTRWNVTTPTTWNVTRADTF